MAIKVQATKNCPITFRTRLQVYIMTPGWFFKVMARADLEQQMSEIRMSAVESTADAAEATPQANGKDDLANGAPQGKPWGGQERLSAQAAHTLISIPQGLV